MRLIAGAILVVTGAGIIYFGYLGSTSEVWEGDSLAYHIPIARIVASGRTGEKGVYTDWLYYYPGVGEAMLAVLMKLGVPLNLFNLLGWVVLGAAVVMWGRQVGMGTYAATVMGAGVMWWPSVVRLVLTQTVDIWLAAFWMLAVIWLEKKKTDWKYWAVLGIWLGALLGVKYSGPLFLGVLGVFYWRRLWEGRRWWGVMAAMIILVGGSWYFRNWAWTGNWIYPAGEAGFRLLEWKAGEIVVKLPGKFIEAVVSEYLIWPILGMAMLRFNKFWWLGVANWAVYMLLPSWPNNVISDLRYAYPAMLPWMAIVWKWAKDRGKENLWTVLALAMVVVEWAQLDYRPKLFAGVLMGLWLLGLKNWRRL